MKLILPEKGGGGDLNRKILMGRPKFLAIYCTLPKEVTRCTRTNPYFSFWKGTCYYRCAVLYRTASTGTVRVYICAYRTLRYYPPRYCRHSICPAHSALYVATNSDYS